MAVDIGETYPLGIVVRDVDEAGTPINAGTVQLRVTLPDQTVVVVPVQSPAAPGYYAADYVPAQAGRHLYQWRTTDPNRVLEGAFDVAPPWSAGILTLANAKKLVKIDASDTAHDDDLRGVILSVTEVVENVRREVVVRRPVVETRRLRGWRYEVALLAHRPVLSVTSVTSLDSGVVWTPPSLDIDEHGIVRALAGGPFHGRLRIDYVAGYQVIPPAFTEAAGYILQHLWANRGGSSNRPRVGGQAAASDRDDGGMGYSIPNRARDLLGHAPPLVG